MSHPHICNKCGVELTSDNWRIYTKENHVYLCNACINEKNRLYAERVRRQNGCSTMEENRSCPSFLGVHIAEEVLLNVFVHVERMPYGTPGYDFICNRGKKVDVKSSCIRVITGHSKRWCYHINQNTNTDYFLCIAFDDRESLNPLYLWMIPAGAINDRLHISISESTLHKWDKYKLEIDKVISCCNIMKAHKK